MKKNIFFVVILIYSFGSINYSYGSDKNIYESKKNVEITLADGTHLISMNRGKTYWFKSEKISKNIDLNIDNFEKFEIINYNENSLNNDFSLYIFPNPVTIDPYISLNSSENSNYKFEIFNKMGERIEEFNYYCYSGNNKIIFSSYNLKHGSFVVRLKY